MHITQYSIISGHPDIPPRTNSPPFLHGVAHPPFTITIHKRTIQSDLPLTCTKLRFSQLTMTATCTVCDM